MRFIYKVFLGLKLYHFSYDNTYNRDVKDIVGVDMMISKILEISRVSPIEPYGKQNGGSDENSRKKQSLDFADILAEKMSVQTKQPGEAYRLDLSSLSHLR